MGTVLGLWNCLRTFLYSTPAAIYYYYVTGYLLQLEQGSSLDGRWRPRVWLTYLQQCKGPAWP